MNAVYWCQGSREAEFWSSVDPWLVEVGQIFSFIKKLLVSNHQTMCIVIVKPGFVAMQALGGETCYKTDLDMFGYSVSSYMDGLNLDIQLATKAPDLATNAPDLITQAPDLGLSPTWVPGARGRRGGGGGEEGRPRQS